MKKLFTLFVIAALTISVFAQSPQKMSYQAVVRNTSGVLQANQAVGMKISILQGSETGTAVYVETQTKTTNANGLVTLEVGSGTIVSGTFAGIDWSNGTYYIKTETDPTGGTSYTITGTSQILSVPYALYSKIAKTANYNDLTNKPTTLSGYGITDAVTKSGTQTITGTTTFKGTTPNMEESLFDVKNKDGQTIFAVYNEGVRIWVADGAKGTKGGFAVGGFDMTKGTNTNYFNVNTDASDIINPSQNKILWYPLKNAFFTGKVLITSPLNVGENSFATGYEPRASGMYSQAMGYKAAAYGDYSTAIGKNAMAGNINSFALGDSPSASGLDSYAFGAGAIASGVGSYAFGSDGRDKDGNLTGAKTTASGPYSFAIGQGSVASATTAFASGFVTTASGKASTAIGFGTIASGENSTALGTFTRSYGGGSTSMGMLAVANSNGSTAMGVATSATGEVSTALGYYSRTNANYATAMGQSTYASGIGSTAIGNSTTASGYGSTSMGIGTVASGYSSTAMGTATTAPSGYETAIGRFNTAYTPVYTQDWWPTDRLFVIGNGTGSSALSNAVTVYKNGVTEFSDHLNINMGSSGPALYVNTNEAIWYDGATFSWGFGGTANVFADHVSVGTTANPGTYSLYVAGTAWCSSGAWSGSDIRWKKNIADLNDNLDKILHLKGVRFEWKKDEFPDQGFETGTQIGLIAQDVEKLFPELVRTDDNGFKAVSYEKLSVVLLEGMKEQQHQIRAVEQENQQLKSELNELRSLINSFITIQSDQVNK